MPRQIFDIEQYELRGTLPQVYTENQKSVLNRVVSRVNGQLDWTAQLLGFNGSRYWGNPSIDADGQYTFTGLPQTVNEKRALQTGAFGVYNKDKPYESWPAPFNRNSVRASADQSFSVEERDGKVVCWPFGQVRDFTYAESAYLIAGGAYTFNQLVDCSVFGADPSTIQVIQDIDQRITRVRILNEDVTFVSVYLEGSQAKPFTFTVRKWKDSSDWNDPDVLERFLGAWGSKGNQLSMHFAFDALDLHGFNEVDSLSLETVQSEITIARLLSLIGLKPGPLSSLVSAPYTFEVEGCEVEGPFSPSVEFQPTSEILTTEDFFEIQLQDGRTLVSDVGVCATQDAIFMLTDGNDGTGDQVEYDNGFFFDEGAVGCYTDNGTLEQPGSVTGTLADGVYDLTGTFPAQANGIYDINPQSICDDDPDTTPTELLSNGEYPGDYFPVPGTTVDNEGTYDISIEQLMTEDLKLLAANSESFDYSGCYRNPDAEFGVCDTCDYTLTLKQVFDDTPNEIAIDPGPESSIPIGLNGFMRTFPVNCGKDNGTLEDATVNNFFMDRAGTFSWEDLVPLSSFEVVERDGNVTRISAQGGFFTFSGRSAFINIAPPASGNGVESLDNGVDVVSNIPTYTLGNGQYDIDPASLCDEPVAPEVDINYDDLIIDVLGEAGPILVSDSGVENEIILIAGDDSEVNSYDGLSIAFDGLELAQLSFDYEAKTPFAVTEFPTVEWVVDLQLDNGSYLPVSDEGAWMGTDDGDFDERTEFVRMGTIISEFDSETDVVGLNFKDGILTFDDGEFDQLVEPNCDFEGGSPCALVDGGVFVEGADPTVPDTNCFEECGKIDSGNYAFYGFIPPAFPVVDGQGSRTIPDSCVLYNNGEFDRVPRPGVDGEGYYSCTSYDNSVYPFQGIYTCNLEEWGEFDGPPSNTYADEGEYTNLNFPETCAPCGPVPEGFDCYINNGTMEEPGTSEEVDEGFYDNAFEICEPCITEVEPTVPCYVPPVRVRLDKIIYSNMKWKFNPSVLNAQTPLRVWKNHVLEVVDDQSEAITNDTAAEFLETRRFHNNFVADHNTGPESESSYRYFVRLPAEYSRNGRLWNKASNVTSAYGYFSSVFPLSETAVKPNEIRPYLYDDVYCQCAADLPDYAIFYQEDYLVSSIKTARINAEAGFQEANIEFEDAAEVFPFAAGLITDYDAYEQRTVRDIEGDWAGTYFKWQRRGPLTGYLVTDLEDYILREVEYLEQPAGDASLIKTPNTEFPDDTDVANFANYVVSYAYFTADLSGADEPVFDPVSKYNWRECNIPRCKDGTSVFETDITGIEILTEDGFSLGLGGPRTEVEDAVESNTAYLLNRCDKFVAPEIDLRQFLESPTRVEARRASASGGSSLPGAPSISIDTPGGTGILSGAVRLTGTVANANRVQIQIGTSVGDATVVGGAWEYAMTPQDFAEFVRTSSATQTGTITATALTDTSGLTAIARTTAELALPTNRNRTLVAVIDENQGAVGWMNDSRYHGPLPNVDEAWSQFRQKWPDRPFYLLEPVGGWGGFSTPMPAGEESRIKIPQQFIDEVIGGVSAFYNQVSRDRGQASQATDWYELINGDALPEGAEIALFVDNSGSLTTAQVQASYNLFLEKLAARNIGIIVVEDFNEDWIGPFMGDLFGDEETGD